MKTHKPIILRFWVKGDVNLLYVGWAHVSLILYLLKSSPKRPKSDI